METGDPDLKSSTEAACGQDAYCVRATIDYQNRDLLLL